MEAANSCDCVQAVIFLPDFGGDHPSPIIENMPTPLSYSDTSGFPQLHMSRVINADFDAAAHRLFRWTIQRSGLFRVRATHPLVEPGAEVTLGLGPWDFRCRVVEVFRQDGRCGFTYGTLPGHLERGEETFTLERLRDGRTLLLIDAASEPFLPCLRPLVDVPRRLLISRLYLHALDD
mgnify:CR=1 FL=1